MSAPRRNKSVRRLLLAANLLAAAAALGQGITVGPEVPIGRNDGVTSRNAMSGRYLSEVASSGSMALAAWIDSRESAIYVTRVGIDGRPLDPFSIRVASITDPEELDVHWNGKNFVVVWQFRRHNGDPAMFEPEFRIGAAEVTTDGRVLEPGGVDLATGILYSIAAGFNRTVIVARPLPADFHCAPSAILLLGDGLKVQNIDNPAPPCNRPRVSVNGDGFMTLWFRVSDDGVGRDLWGQRFRPDGELVDRALIRLAAELDLPGPTVTFGDSGGSSLIQASDYNYSSVIRVSPELSVTRTENVGPVGRDALVNIEPLDNGRYAITWDHALSILGPDDHTQMYFTYAGDANVSATVLGSRIYLAHTTSTMTGAFLDSPSDAHALSLTTAPAHPAAIAATPGGGIVSAWQSDMDVHAAKADSGAQQFSPAVSVASNSSSVFAVAADNLGPIIAAKKFETGELEVLRLDPSLKLSKSGTFLPVDGDSRVALATNGYVVIAAWMTDGVPYWSSAFPDGARMFNYVTQTKATLLSLASNGRDFVVLARTPEGRLHVTHIDGDGIHANSEELADRVTDAAVCAADGNFAIVEQIGNRLVIGSRTVASAPSIDRVAAASNGDTILLVWRDGGTRQIFARALTTDGAPMEAPVPIARGDFAATSVVTLADGTYAVAYTAAADSSAYLRVLTVAAPAAKASPSDRRP
jgi:hypothetical protein